MKVRVGDLVTYEWATNLSFHGLVVGIKDASELHGKHSILYSFELLEENDKRFWYDVWAGVDEDKIIIHNR
jgi:hypothetical protein